MAHAFHPLPLHCRALAALTLLIAATGANASISPIAPGKAAPNTLYFRLDGNIAVGDTAKLQSMLDERKAVPGKMNVWVHMTARGGDLQEAFRLGRLLRKYKAYSSHGQCVGTCVYAFMGAHTRYYTAPIPQPEMSMTPPDKTGLWVYEPYVMAKVLPLVKTNAKIAKALDEVRDYTVEMTGKPDFYNSVIKIPHTNPIRMTRNNVFDMNVGSLEANGGKKMDLMPMAKNVPAW